VPPFAKTARADGEFRAFGPTMRSFGSISHLFLACPGMAPQRAKWLQLFHDLSLAIAGAEA
jgi:hypothetical protein